MSEKSQKPQVNPDQSMVIGGLLYIPDGKGGMKMVGLDPLQAQTRINQKTVQNIVLDVSGLGFDQPEVDCKDC